MVTMALWPPVVTQSADGHEDKDAELPRLRPQRSRSFHAHAASAGFSEDDDAGLPPAAKLPKCVLVPFRSCNLQAAFLQP